MLILISLLSCAIILVGTHTVISAKAKYGRHLTKHEIELARSEYQIRQLNKGE